MNRFFFLIFFLIFSSCDCYKRLEKTGGFVYKGTISEYTNSSFSFRYFLKFDSLNNAQLKLYNESGIKLYDVLIYQDSVNVLYSLSNSYDEIIYSVVRSQKGKFCYNYFLRDLFVDSLLIKKNLCYNSNCIEDANGLRRIEISNLSYNTLFSVEFPKKDFFVKEPNSLILVYNNFKILITKN